VGFNEELMRKTIGGLLLLMFFIILYKPDKWIKGQVGKIIGKPTILQMVILLFSLVFTGGLSRQV